MKKTSIITANIESRVIAIVIITTNLHPSVGRELIERIKKLMSARGNGKMNFVLDISKVPNIRTAPAASAVVEVAKAIQARRRKVLIYYGCDDAQGIELKDSRLKICTTIKEALAHL